MKPLHTLLTAVACAGLTLPSAMMAQQSVQTLVASNVVSSNDGVDSSATLSVPAAKPVVPEQSLTGRWLDLSNFSHSERYRNQYGDDGAHYFEDGQQQSLISGRIKLDADERYAIDFRASSGRTFNWSYADYAGRGFKASLNNPYYPTDISDPSGDPTVLAAYQADPKGVAVIDRLNSAGWEFYMRELYLSATPVKPVTVEFGSFGFERGYSTEITTFDNDGYLTGERVRLDDPKHFFFDQISATSAYFGYFNQPNLFDRGGGFSKSNYRQVAAKKQLTPRVGISGEWNWISNNAKTNTLREAIVVNVNESKVLDRFRIEGYEMVNHVSLQGDDERARQGFAIVGEKKIGKLSGDFGFASIDRDYGLYSGSSFMQEVGFSLNGDTYNTSIRIFSHVSYKINPVVTAFGFYTRMTGQIITDLNNQGLNAGLSFDLKALVNTEKRVF